MLFFYLFPSNATLNVPNFRYRNIIWCLLLGKPNVYAWTNLDCPKLDHFRSKFVTFSSKFTEVCCFSSVLAILPLYLLVIFISALNLGRGRGRGPP